jgi:tRNA pseudouridine55 synthase
MTLFGFLVVDKPQGMTSHDVVAKVRRGAGIKRVGHAGTLDPLATGALIVCIGTAARLSDYVMHQEKVYRATVRLGVETDTYDTEGVILAQHDISHLTPTAIATAIARFQGEIDQTPPMYSAIKQGGKKLYELARAGIEVERAVRRVHLATVLLETSLPDLHLEITCSAGTYIRSLAHDLGAVLGVGAHLTALRRTRTGNSSELVPWEALQTAFGEGSWARYLKSERDLLPHIPEVRLDAATSDAILHGRPIVLPDSYESALLRAYDPADRFIALLEPRDTQWGPSKVFA